METTKSKQDEGTENEESSKIDDNEQKLEKKVTLAKITTQEDGTDNKESGKSNNTIFDGELKPENKICITNKSVIEDGPPPAIKIGESKLIDNEESSGSSEDKMFINYNTFDSDDRPQTTNTDERHTVDGELKPENKICITNKSGIEDGPPPAIKIGESKLIDNEESSGSSEDKMFINYNTFDSDDRPQTTNTDERHTGEMRLRDFGTLESSNSRKRYQNQDEGSDDNELYLLKKIKIEDTSDDPFQEMWSYHLEYNSSNFEQWENILYMVDLNNIVVNARIAYTKFLELYPLCYGYWRKYANFERRNNNMDEFEKVIENGLIAIPISVDLWIYYMTYLRTERPDEVDHIRNEFKRSLKLCGLDYHSDQLWHDYISWEVERTELYNAAQIYYHLICTPTSNYLNNFFKFQEFIFTKIPGEYLDHEEYTKRRNIIIQSLETTHNNIESSNYESIPPGEDFHQKTEFTEDHIMFLLRIGIINEWHDSHKETGKQFESRKIFEENIRRPHFHVNELDSAEIKNWGNYVKFERRFGRNHERIAYLYERCLITCVYNEEFWLDYLEYLSIIKNMDVTDLLSDVFGRSLSYHPKSLLLNLKYIDFCETQGLENIADETIRQLEVDYPDSREVSIKNINLARKYGTLGTVYKHYLNSSQSKSFSSYIAVRYARFVWKHDRQLNLAYDILCDTIRNNDISVNDSFEIYTTLVELEMELNPKDHIY
ncbi:pre-mRNA-processing factor 39-like [Metopolophium dirhodum]|uniref:pre-mRNA-processing factor 39-like n=1 Tax=Metopolophium dirhodum TaxID=44670 RepID=UPI002990710E|nr:pre-mRNA-processing factor 39-like [Metopolophium dirhodum]